MSVTRTNKKPSESWNVEARYYQDVLFIGHMLTRREIQTQRAERNCQGKYLTYLLTETVNMNFFSIHYLIQ